MTNFSNVIVKAAGEDRVLNVRPDPPDIRDRLYEPALVQLLPKLDNSALGKPLNQGKEGACTGFGLAAVINILNAARNKSFLASPRMLYEMAQRNDMWPGQDYSGSSCRGAIQGWRNMGVCSDTDWPYEVDVPGHLTVERARRARSNTVGAYYRLRPEIGDYHAALNEVGAIFVSASVHKGWHNPVSKRNRLSVIRPTNAMTGGHAFAIVGYTRLGFIVQNSWGEKWGTKGCALWRYEDWQENVRDGWVFRLALSTPSIFSKQPVISDTGTTQLFQSSPKRFEIAGHFAHFDDGKYSTKGKYHTEKADIQETTENLEKSLIDNPDKYKHLVFYAHGGLNSTKDSAIRIAKMKDGFKRNSIYPFHIMYDTGLAEEIKDLIIRGATKSTDQAPAFLDWLGEAISDTSDQLIEDLIRKPGTALWEEMKRDAAAPFDQGNDGVNMLKAFTKVTHAHDLQVHLLGHSAGALVHGHILSAIEKNEIFPSISSASLLAPACSVDFYNKHYKTLLEKDDASPVRLQKLHIYNLKHSLEIEDSVALIYRKSLLTLISKAFERGKNIPLLGLEKYNTGINLAEFFYSNGKSGPTKAKSHSDFDNDHFTLNSVLKTILGHAPKYPFREKELK
ncbi:MAG: C1 family peptidase [Sneathiella sp.]|nr:C1 family peptidase [Sneathiella sp.]